MKLNKIDKYLFLIIFTEILGKLADKLI